MGIGNLSIQCGSRTNNALRTNVGFSVGNREVDRFNGWRNVSIYAGFYSSPKLLYYSRVIRYYRYYRSIMIIFNTVDITSKRLTYYDLALVIDYMTR